MAFGGAFRNPWFAAALFTAAWGCGSEGIQSERDVGQGVSGADVPPTQAWARTTLPVEQGVAVDASGNVIVLAQTEDDSPGFGLALYKYDPSGRPLWEQQWRTFEQVQSYTKLAVDAKGNILVGGNWTDTAASKSGFLAQKYDPEGHGLWQREWQGTDLVDLAFEVDGDIALLSRDHLTVIDLDGGPRFQNGWTGVAVRISLDGGIYIAGGLGPSGQHAELAKFNPRGSLAWTYSFAAEANPSLVLERVVRALAVDAQGNATITGDRAFKANVQQPVFVYQYMTTRVSAAGAQIWQREDDFNQNGGIPSAIALDSSGNVTVTGVTRNMDAPGLQIFLTCQYDAGGALRWELQDHWNDAPVPIIPVGLAVDAAGVAYVTGNIGDGANQPGTVAYGTTGNVVWRARDVASGRAAGIAVDVAAKVAYVATTSEVVKYVAP